jgi:FKBP-type peptidyl-prolyl cis-trans isomerase (trigger factor)
MLKTGPQIDLTGQQSADGDSDVETVQGGEQQEEALRQYRQNLEQYEALRESVLENEAIPLGHRQTIRRYFELIRPESTDAEP